MKPRGTGCSACGGSGWRVVETAAGSHAERCACWAAGERERRLRRAGIPPGLQHCELESFETQHHPQLELGLRAAREFFDAHPLPGPGLLFHGPAGTGKTHLVIGIVSALVLRKGAHALFLDFRHLLKTIQESYNAVSQTSEKEVLRRILEADVLALDDLGAEKPSPWVRETVAYLINERYNQGKPLLITTNLRHGPASRGSDEAARPGGAATGRTSREEAHRQMAQRVGREGEAQLEYLEDRVGTATLSRLYEMCKHVPLTEASDYRRKMKFFGTDKGWQLG